MTPPRALLGIVAALLLATLFGIGLVRGLGARIDDFDELWHLATGRVIVETGAVPTRDPFTFTAGEAPWTNSNWLAQVVLWETYRAGGFEGAWLLGLGLFLGAAGLALERARRVARSPWVLVPVAYLVLRALRTGSTVRPQGWTFLLLALALLLVDRVREKGGLKAALALAAVLALAGEMHGGFVFPLGAVVVFAAGELVVPGAAGRRAGWLLAGAALLGVASFALHPHGFDAFFHPARYALDPRLRDMARVTHELKPPDFADPTNPGRITALLVVALVGLALLARERLAASEVVLLVGFVHLALSSTRGLHYLALVAAAPLARLLDGALARARAEAPAFVRARLATLDALSPAAAWAARLAPVAFGAALVATSLVHVPRGGVAGDVSSPLLRSHSDVATIASYLEAKAPPGRTWNEIETGGFLIWRGRSVFIDGRGDFHARAGTWGEQERLTELRPGWEKTLDRWSCDLALVTRGTRVEVALRKSWRVAFETGSLVLLVRPGSPSDLALR